MAIIRGSQPPRTSGGLAKASCLLGSCGGARDGLYNAMNLSCRGSTISKQSALTHVTGDFLEPRARRARANPIIAATPVAWRGFLRIAARTFSYWSRATSATSVAVAVARSDVVVMGFPCAGLPARRPRCCGCPIDGNLGQLVRASFVPRAFVLAVDGRILNQDGTEHPGGC